MYWTARHPLRLPETRQHQGFRSYVRILAQRVLGLYSPSLVPTLHEQSRLACDEGVRLKADQLMCCV